MEAWRAERDGGCEMERTGEERRGRESSTVCWYPQRGQEGLTAYSLERVEL